MAVAQHAIGRHGAGEPNDGVSVGWAGGDHVLDTTIDLGKNVVNDALHLAIRVDTDKIPGSLLRAYTRIETDARAKMNPSGTPTKAQRAEAKEAAKARAESEAADGRFRRMAHYPVLWDGQSNVLYAGTASLSVLDRLQTLFRETFDRDPRADQRREPGPRWPRLGARPGSRASGRSGYIGEDGHSSVAWSDSDYERPDYWGNEFLIWLWHVLQADGDTIALPDGSDVTVMMSKTLTLDCPRGETGRDQLTTEGADPAPRGLPGPPGGQAPPQGRPDPGPPRLAVRADAPGRDPGRLGRGDAQDRRGLGHELQVARVDALRHLVETLDLLYDAYGRRRTGPDWTGELGRIRRWLRLGGLIGGKPWRLEGALAGTRSASFQRMGFWSIQPMRYDSDLPSS